MGFVNPNGEIVQGESIRMRAIQQIKDGAYLFEATAQCAMSGLHGYTVRVLPYHVDLVTLFLPGYITWAG